MAIEVPHRRGLIVLPTVADGHVHFRHKAVGYEEAEDFESGSRGALLGGVTAVMDMPNDPGHQTDSHLRVLEKVQDLTDHPPFVEVGLSIKATHESTRDMAKSANFLLAAKYYMDITTGEDDPANDFSPVFKMNPRKLLAVAHAEGPSRAEYAFQLAEINDLTIILAHTTADQLEVLEKYKTRRPDQVFGEVTPHHALLAQDDIPSLPLPSLGYMKPFLQDRASIEKIWEAIKSGLLSTIGTDHAPHPREAKIREVNPAFGITGVQTSLILMYSEFIRRGIDISRLVEMMCTNPRAIYRMPAQPESYVYLDPSRKTTIKGANLETKSKLTAFEDRTVDVAIDHVDLRGETIVLDNEIIAPPRGRVIYPY